MELLLILRRLISSPQNIQLLFDLYAGEINEPFGFGSFYRKVSGNTTYLVEFHLECIVTFQLTDFNNQSFHFYREIHHSDGWLATTAETLTLHVDQLGSHVAQMLANILKKFTRSYKSQKPCPNQYKLAQQFKPAMVNKSLKKPKSIF